MYLQHNTEFKKKKAFPMTLHTQNQLVVAVGGIAIW
jgi:hypothetical protein